MKYRDEIFITPEMIQAGAKKLIYHLDLLIATPILTGEEMKLAAAEIYLVMASVFLDTLED